MKSKWYFKHRTACVIKLHCRFDVHSHQANQHTELQKQGRIHYEIHTYTQNPSFHTLQNKSVFYYKLDHFRSPDPLFWESPAGVMTGKHRLSPSAALRLHAVYAALWHTADVTTWACWSNSAASATWSDSDVRWWHTQRI